MDSCVERYQFKRENSMQKMNTSTIEHFPVELLIQIFQKLDTPSHFAVYETCRRWRGIIVSLFNDYYTFNKVCTFSMNRMATTESLKLNFLNDICRNLHTLNLYGVANLNSTDLVPALLNMKNLRSLNVGYTPIEIKDLLGLENYCVHLIDITINYIENIEPMVGYVLGNYKKFFKNFKYVHLIGYRKYLFDRHGPVMFLEESDLHTIDFECISGYGDEGIAGETLGYFRYKNLNIYFSLVNVYKYDTLNTFFYILTRDENLEYIIIDGDRRIERLFYSPGFDGYFKNKTDGYLSFTKLECTENPYECDWRACFRRKCYFGCYYATMMIWDKNQVTFDDSFYNDLEERLSNVPHTFLIQYEGSSNEKSNKWIRIHSSRAVKVEDPYDLVDESIVGSTNEIPKFPKNFNNFHLLTYLDLFYQQPGDNYCEHLMHCTNLNTLRLTFTSPYCKFNFIYCGGYVNMIALRYFLRTKNKRLRNLQLKLSHINFFSLYADLMSCVNIENIDIADIGEHTEIFQDPIPLFKSCTNLYSFVCGGKYFNREDVKIVLSDINDYKVKYNKTHLNVELYNNSNGQGPATSPFQDVFKLRPLLCASLKAKRCLTTNK